MLAEILEILRDRDKELDWIWWVGICLAGPTLLLAILGGWK